MKTFKALLRFLFNLLVLEIQLRQCLKLSDLKENVEVAYNKNNGSNLIVHDVKLNKNELVNKLFNGGKRSIQPVRSSSFPTYSYNAQSNLFFDDVIEVLTKDILTRNPKITKSKLKKKSVRKSLISNCETHLKSNDGHNWMCEVQFVDFSIDETHSYCVCKYDYECLDHEQYFLDPSYDMTSDTNEEYQENNKNSIKQAQCEKGLQEVTYIQWNCTFNPLTARNHEEYCECQRWNSCQFQKIIELY